MPTLSNEEILRYSRHLIMPEVGMPGQEKLKQASILLIGAGGLGSPLALYLSAAGVGRLGIVDFDVVDSSNLHRQVIHNTSSVGKLKVDSAKERIAEINPNVVVETYAEPITRDNILNILKNYDMVIDGTDNFPTRYLVNDAAVMLGKTNIYGSIFRFDGQVTVFKPKEGPCYRCLYPEPPPPGMVPSCAEGGVLGILPGTVGLMQATEAVKQIIGKGRSLVGRLMQYDALDMSFKEFKLRRDPQCPVCGDHPTITELIDYEQFCGVGRGGEEAEDMNGVQEISVQILKKWMDEKKDFKLIDVRETTEWEICNLPGATLIPLSTLSARVNEIDSSDEVVLQCRSGARSAKAYKLLEKFGYKKIYNLEGGILKWAEEIDTDMPTY